MNENFYQRAENLKDGEFSTKQKAWKSQVVFSILRKRIHILMATNIFERAYKSRATLP